MQSEHVVLTLILPVTGMATTQQNGVKCKLLPCSLTLTVNSREYTNCFFWMPHQCWGAIQVTQTSITVLDRLGAKHLNTWYNLHGKI